MNYNVCLLDLNVLYKVPRLFYFRKYLEQNYVTATDEIIHKIPDIILHIYTFLKSQINVIFDTKGLQHDAYNDCLNY